jgi:hypothetical protein
MPQVTLDLTETGYLSEKKHQKIVQIPFERQMVEFVDNLVLIARKNGSSMFVKTSKDWDTIDFIYKGFAVLYPKTAEDFAKHMIVVHNATQFNHGIVKEKNGAMLEHILEIPAPLYKMIDVIFPMQKWDRKFANKFRSHFPLMAGSLKGIRHG